VGLWLGFRLARQFGLALLQGGDGLHRITGVSRQHIGQASAGIVDQQQMDALTLKPVVVVQPVCIDQGDVAFTVLW